MTVIVIIREGYREASIRAYVEVVWNVGVLVHEPFMNQAACSFVNQAGVGDIGGDETAVAAGDE